MSFIKTILTVLFFTLTTKSFSQKRIEKIDSIYTDLYNRKLFNGNILIAEKGKPVYEKSFGLANEQTKEKLDQNSVFELASVSKQFTAMAIVILKEKGKLNYEDNLSKYIPEMGVYKNITIRHLLNHTGGLPDYMELMDSLFDKTKIATNKDIIELFAKHKPKILFEPNTQYEYSNTGYALLASVIEKVSGQSYKDFLSSSIFQPLKMNRTFVYTRRYQPQKIDNYAYGYIYSDSLKRNILPDSLEEGKIVIWLDGIVGDGTVNSTVIDLLAWDRALYTTDLVSKSAMKEIFTPSTLNDKTKSNYGFGWSIENNKEYGKIAEHSGGWPGYVTYIERHLESDKTIIVLQNTDRATLRIKNTRALLYNKPLIIPVTRKEIQLPKETILRYTGEYKISNDLIFKIFTEGDLLKAQLSGQSASTIFAESETRFFLKVVDAQIEFILNKEKKVEKLVLHQNGNNIEAIKIK